MNRRPLAFLFLSALLGAFFGTTIDDVLWVIFSLLLAMLMPIIIRHTLFRIASLLLFTLFLMAFLAALEKERFLATVSSIPHDDRIFSGVILRASKKEDGSTVIVAKVKAITDPHKNPFNLMVHLTGALAHMPVSEGALVRFRGKAEPFLHPLSPIHFDAVRFGLARDIHGRLHINDLALLWVGPRAETSYFGDLRKKLIDRTLAVITPRESSLLLALMIGDTNLFNREQTDIFRDIGAQHLLAVSGLQITILAAICFFLLMPLLRALLPKKYSYRAHACAALATIALTFWFIGLAGFPKSAVRAFLMATFMLLPTIIARKIDPFDAFFASGLLTILLFPMCAMDLGYLLSYAAVFGLLVAHERSLSLRERFNNFSFLLRWFLLLLISATAAFLATLPIIALYFHVIAPFSIVANLILVPIASLLQIPAIIFGLIGGLLPWPLLIKIAAFFSNVIEICAQALCDILGAQVFLPPIPPYAIMLMLVAIILAFLWVLKPNRVFLPCAAFLLVCPLSTLFLKNDHLDITVIPVGQGDASLFSFPNGAHMLVDAGGSVHSEFDPGERIVVPTLKHKGVKEIDFLVISHPDPDHILGAFAVIESFKVKEIWHSGFSPEHHLTKRLIDTAHSKGILVKDIKDILGSHRVGMSEIQVLAPDTLTDELFFNELPANDNSVVLRIIHGNHALLWPGDIEYFGEQLLISSKRNLLAHILKAPHHGSKTSSSEDFIKLVNPSHVIYSTGRNNRFRFPHEEVVNRYRKLGIEEWNTAIEGEISIKVSENKILLRGYCPPFKEKTRVLPSLLKIIG